MNTHFPIHLFEEHSSILPVWWQSRGTPATVVYLDAHLDLQQISAAQIDSLKQCRSLNELKSLESPHHLNRSPRYAFGIENFLYAASELGLIKRLIWVVPPHIPKTYSSSLLDIVQQMEGITFSELTSFKAIEDYALRGTLLGLDITLCGYQDLHRLTIDEPWYLDIDIDYFVSVPEDRLWANPASVLKSILQQLGDPAVATISRAVGSGFMPLSMRFVADLAAAVLKQDQSTENHYRQLLAVLDQLAQHNTQSALELCRASIKNRPDCAASHYLVSMALDMDNQAVKQVSAARERAIKLDKRYAFDLTRVASGFPNRHQPLNRTQLQQLANQLERTESSQKAVAEIAVGRLYAAQGALKEAWQLLQKQTGELTDHCELSMAIARGILSSNEPVKAKTLLESAAKSDSTRCQANLLLGDLAYQSGELPRALQHYQTVSRYAPAWLLPIERQLACLQGLNDTRQIEQVRNTILQRKQRLAQLLS